MQQENSISRANAFESLIGTWNVHNRLMKRNFALPNQSGDETEWVEFTGHDRFERHLNGRAVVEHWEATMPSGVQALGLSIKAFEPETQQWSIIWIDDRNPLDFQPLQGSFTNGVGTFYQVSKTSDGQPLHVRFIWDEMTATSARWRQAYSFDEGEHWETNWIMHFTR